MSASLDGYYIGVDVGTGSARACLIDSTGTIVALAAKDISRWSPKSSYWNQSSTQIWDSICYCTNKIVADAQIDPNLIKGIGFDATCSLVVIHEKEDKPVGVGPDFDNHDQNVILWMDHRAEKQTKEINKTGHNLLRYVGGGMSVEMEIPKAKWLKENMPKGVFDQCKLYDLADYLTHRATGSETRSFCSVVCKQGYVPVGVDGSVKGWSEEFLNTVGLPELVEDNFRRVGGVIGQNGQYLSAGETIGHLTEKSAKELGLSKSIAVGSGVIDAYAGWIGTVASKFGPDDSNDIIESSDVAFNRLAAVAGTSTCHLVMSKDAVFVPGVWGPYKNVMIPDRWLAEGGQSTTGELLHHVVTTHPASDELKTIAERMGVSTFAVLNSTLEQMAKDQGVPSVVYLAKHYFFYGDLYGNRSPIADSSMRGSIVGESMDVSLNALAIKYLAAVEFIGQQTRHIIEALNKAGHQVKEIYLSGGQCRNTLLTQLMATCTGMPVIIPKYIEASVVLGAAMLGAKAASEGKLTLWEVMSKLSGKGSVIEPQATDSVDYKLVHAKYEIFLDQAERQRKYRKIVDEALGENE
ncbi:putative phosphotransferase [Sugiyamaella lignohabitans]|uniref:Putative phosphotransferase n=1 Tax=Sugiyamaella lignohabitans TaxID=796027 RepID=A0A167C6C1_9ASCO|nr:putative phosphotransferase [Sugiyamaella lignohabitans]ANB11274.1 putative phosphotransferase [Sugiyamaella lignohabitans]